MANCGEVNFLLTFASYLAFLVLYKIFFGLIHIYQFKIRACSDDMDYSKEKVNRNTDVTITEIDQQNQETEVLNA